jgi:hypothetical protein
MVTLTKTEDGRLRLEDTDIIVKDVVATNGVIHIIDSLVVPTSGRPLDEVLEDRAGRLLQPLMGGMRADGLLARLSGLRNVSLFLPIEPIPSDLLAEFRGDEKKLEELVLHHVLPGIRPDQGFR